ncbi:MAG TPA: HAD family phosphatase [Candidatus Edwardsbacteria bacterium]|nr:HAD family phosphatase [Candidatus Edwardsbacteria bacterium]
MITAILFDCDGVVLDSEPLWDRAQDEFLRRRGLAYDRDKLKHLMTGSSLVGAIRIMQERYGFGGDPEQLALERMEIVRGLFASHVEFVPGFTGFFRSLGDAYKTCIATSLHPELLALADARLKLSSYFGERMYTVAEVGGVGKPDPAIFLYAAKKLGTAPDECLVIEDSPFGIEAAQRAGMRCAALTTTYGRDRLAAADQVCGGFAEIDLPVPQPIRN